MTRGEVLANLKVDLLTFSTEEIETMNHSKIAAALHALADAFLADVEAVEQTVTGGKKGGKKTVDPTPAAAATAPAVSPATPSVPASAAPVAAAPAAPSVALKDVNALVLKVAAKNRDQALAVLAKFKLANTVGLAAELWQPVYDAFEEEIAKIDAAAVQVAQASLV